MTGAPARRTAARACTRGDCESDRAATGECHCSVYGSGQVLVLKDFPDPSLARLLSPNGRAHWAHKRTARKYVEQSVWVAACIANLERMQGHVVMWPTLVYPVHRKRDDDNAATGVMKAVRDALVHLKVIEADDTDHLKQMPVEILVEKGRRALELRFEVQ